MDGKEREEEESGIDAYRPCKARVPTSQWANQKTALSNPNALIADRPTVREGAFKAPGACRPVPDSLNIELGTSVVGATWGAASPERWRPGHPAMTAALSSGGERSEKSLAPHVLHHNKHTPFGHQIDDDDDNMNGGRVMDNGYHPPNSSTTTMMTASASASAEEERRRRRATNDPRVRERVEREEALRRAAEENANANARAFRMNKTKCLGSNNVFGDYLYEVRGNVNDDDAYGGGGDGGSRSPIEVRPVSAGPPP